MRRLRVVLALAAALLVAVPSPGPAASTQATAGLLDFPLQDFGANEAAVSFDGQGEFAASASALARRRG